MRVVSLVPSWTETLIAAGVSVVGRTRYCIHPAPQVAKISVVGGTKEVDWQKVKALRPDLVLFDQEENTKEMAEACPYPSYASQIKSLSCLAGELERLADRLQNKQLLSFQERINQLLQAKGDCVGRSWDDLPGVHDWIHLPRGDVKTVLYIIWQNPWMVISRETYIASVLSRFFALELLPEFATKYPEIKLDDYDPSSTLLLFSSEPFPFHKKREMLQELPFASCVVNGESYSWFGIRSLQFLEKAMKQ